MVPYTRAAHAALRDYYGIARIAEAMGMSKSAFHAMANRGTTKRRNAKRIYQITGLDVTGGAVDLDE